MAGDEGIEPPSMGLEAIVLPLDQSPVVRVGGLEPPNALVPNQVVRHHSTSTLLVAGLGLAPRSQGYEPCVLTVTTALRRRPGGS